MWRSVLTDVDPFVIKWPDKWETDPEIGPVIHYLNMFLHDIWLRTGGADDAVSEVQVGELYETGIESATVTEIQQNLDGDTFAIDTESQDNEDSWQPVIERVLDKRRVSDNTYSSNYSMLSVRNGKRVYLPEYPDFDSEVIVINEDGSGITVDGNGNDIRIRGNTDKSVNWSSAGQSINFHWFEQGPWWVAI